MRIIEDTHGTSTAVPGLRFRDLAFEHEGETFEIRQYPDTWHGMEWGPVVRTKGNDVLGYSSATADSVVDAARAHVAAGERS
ncbi:hypothetical protein [Corynebacterium sp.]|uniref:hypothetical protein n=1 Tax=Corynebacterium sp. TaxID=1720 RepID=UPI003B3A3C0E